jgi:taurine dioxygenase
MGAEVEGFFSGHAADAPVDAEASCVLRAALDEFQLLVFRETSEGTRRQTRPHVEFEADQHVRWLEIFGPALIENEAGRAYQFVSNTHDEGILGDERFAFHSDHAFMPDPIDVISLYALEVPDGGSQTHFTNGLRAARELPEDLRTRAAGRRARHIIDPAAESGVIAIEGPRREGDLPHAYHPILTKHPRTGEDILYVSEQQTDSVDSLEDAESRSLITDLFDHLYSLPFRYVHDWQVGDLLIWDNRALQHARDAIRLGTSRNLRRVSVGGTPVFEFFRRHPKWGLD